LRFKEGGRQDQPWWYIEPMLFQRRQAKGFASYQRKIGAFYFVKCAQQRLGH
jgi:hypothetical protein